MLRWHKDSVFTMIVGRIINYKIIHKYLLVHRRHNDDFHSKQWTFSWRRIWPSNWHFPSQYALHHFEVWYPSSSKWLIGANRYNWLFACATHLPVFIAQHIAWYQKFSEWVQYSCDTSLGISNSYQWFTIYMYRSVKQLSNAGLIWIGRRQIFIPFWKRPFWTSAILLRVEGRAFSHRDRHSRLQLKMLN